MNRSRYLVAVGILFSLLVCVCWVKGYRINLSRSVPLGIYKLEKRQPVIGDLVAFCIPKRLAHMEVFSHLTISPCFEDGFGFGLPLLKRVTDIESNGVALVVSGDTARSVDSRIFGPIMRREIIGAVRVVYELLRGARSKKSP